MQGRQKYQLRTLYLKLYNEQITDVLAPASTLKKTGSVQ